MEFTGERVIPGQGDVDVLNEHRARYLFARRFSPGKKVLDAACGTGYGTALLAENATEVFGVDIDREAVEYARCHHQAANARFAQADCLALPFTSGEFDLAVAFEIIEHLQNPEEFVKELRRILSPEGLLVLSTPNRLYYTEDRGEVNPFHYREFSYPELEEILRAHFSCCSILFENHIAALLISGSEAQPNIVSLPRGSVIQEVGTTGPARDIAREAHYFVALCSPLPTEPVQPLLYLPSAGNVLRERELHIRLLTEQLSQAKRALEQASQCEQELRQLLEDRTEWAKGLDQQLSAKDADVRRLQTDFEEKLQWALSLQRELEQAREAVQKLQVEFEERTDWALKLDAELKERTDWALKLDAELQERNADLLLLYSSLWYRIGKNLRLSPAPPSDRAVPETGQQ